jgi:hypothetical protein
MRFEVSGIRYQVSGIRYRVSGIWDLVRVVVLRCIVRYYIIHIN